MSGRVILRGTPPVAKPLMMDAVCGQMHPGPVMSRDYLVGEQSGLADVFVYVKAGLEGKGFSPMAEPPVLDQVGCIYEPYMMGIMINQPFKIRNSDSVLHNVHAVPRKNKEFNFGQPLKGQVNERSFALPEVLVRIKCDVHPWMATYVGVVEHPFFAVTDKDGRFGLPPGLPPGKYTIEAHHPKAGSASQETTLGPDESKSIDFTLAVKSAP